MNGPLLPGGTFGEGGLHLGVVVGGRNKVMGVIGRAGRDKENKETSPGPSAYTLNDKHKGPSITMLGKGLLASGKSTPGPGMYEIPSHKSKKGGKLTR